jgi:hypothetical protein
MTPLYKKISKKIRRVRRILRGYRKSGCQWEISAKVAKPGSGVSSRKFAPQIEPSVGRGYAAANYRPVGRREEHEKFGGKFYPKR